MLNALISPHVISRIFTYKNHRLYFFHSQLTSARLRVWFFFLSHSHHSLNLNIVLDFFFTVLFLSICLPCNTTQFFNLLRFFSSLALSRIQTLCMLCSFGARSRFLSPRCLWQTTLNMHLHQSMYNAGFCWMLLLPQTIPKPELFTKCKRKTRKKAINGTRNWNSKESM